MSYIPRPQEIYKHFKGKLYQIITVAEHSETGEKLVIYQALYGEFKIYARELGMFTSKVDKTKYPDAAQEYRFELQNMQADMTGVQSGQQSPVSMQNPETPGLYEQAAHAAVSSAANASTAAASTAAASSAAAEEGQMVRAGLKACEENLTEAERNLDPLILEFLDSNDYEEKLNILAALHHRITNDMITLMAVASDVEVEEGNLEDRYTQLRNCLLTLEKYESCRMR